MIRSVACAALAAVVLSGQQPSRPLTEAETRQAILEAEDRRQDLPDDVQSPAIQVLRQIQAQDVKLLIDLSRSESPVVRRLAIRALGRYERRELAPDLLTLLPRAHADVVAFALAQSLRGPALPMDTEGLLVRQVMEALLVRGVNARRDGFASSPPKSIIADDSGLPHVIRALGRLPYDSGAQIRAVEAFYLRMFELADPDPDARRLIGDVADAVESLTRLHRRLAVPGEETVGWLRRVVEGRRRTYAPPLRLAAMRALVTAREVDLDTLRIAVRDADGEMRRLATVSLGGGGSEIAETERTGLLNELLGDGRVGVRIEAARAWARHETEAHGCQALMHLASEDPDTNVRVVAIGLLGQACPQDVNVTQLLSSLTRVTAPDRWHAAAHALVALARRSPVLAEAPMRGFVKHPEWHLRLYAARAAAIIDDLPVLERLAYDPHHNVREATLAAVKRLKGQDAEPFLADALRQSDHQLLRTAAREMADLQPTPAMAALLASALTRVTAERRETSRDTRLALLERLAAYGDDNHVGTLVPLLRDYDIVVARTAAAVLAGWTGGTHEIDPQPLPRPVPGGSAASLRVEMVGGRAFTIGLMSDVAPIASGRFERLAEQGYYDGLTFHRVVPNFVIQGGSPGANEYAGDSIYTRDERSHVSHRRGTVGLSTRGRDTGDMQFFINLVDNPRLDYEYTVFGTVSPTGMEIVDRLAEGARIATIRVVREKDKQEGKD